MDDMLRLERDRRGMEDFIRDLEVLVCCQKVAMLSPQYVVDGIIEEVALEAQMGEGCFADITDEKHLLNICKKRCHDRLVNYISGKPVTLKLLGESYRRHGVSVPLDGLSECSEPSDSEYEGYGEEPMDDGFPSVSSLADAISRLDAHQSKRYHGVVKDCLGSCNSDVQKALLEADARAIVLRDERRKASRRVNK